MAQGYTLVNRTKPGKLPLFICESTSEPWYQRDPWILALSILGVILLIIAVLFLTLYRKGARPAFIQQYLNIRKRLEVRYA